jgi:hypothetical protein
VPAFWCGGGCSRGRSIVAVVEVGVAVVGQYFLTWAGSIVAVAVVVAVVVEQSVSLK